MSRPSSSKMKIYLVTLVVMRSMNGRTLHVVEQILQRAFSPDNALMLAKSATVRYFDAPVTIEAPARVIPLDELLEKGKALGNASTMFLIDSSEDKKQHSGQI